MDEKENAENMRAIALKIYKAGERLEATFKRYDRTLVIYYRNPSDIPLYVERRGLSVWSAEWFKWYLWNVKKGR